MKALFLDIDGVLVTSKHLEKNGINRSEFDPACVQHLNEILIQTGATIVVSSSWRIHRTLDELKTIFLENGIKGEITGKTPFFNDLTIMRGDEIQAYLNEHPLITEFVILDDEENMKHLAPFYLQTDFRYGITKEIKEQVIQSFNRQSFSF